jgi:hypothetical protein
VADARVAQAELGQSAVVDLWGDNFAPTPMLTCLYRDPARPAPFP